MKYFLDTEFHEDGWVIDLISIGIVAEDGRELYMVSSEFDEPYARTNDWLAKNVLPYVQDGERFTRAEIAAAVKHFCSPERYGEPELWGFYADYDWVALCQLFGKMKDLPTGWPMFCRDLRQLIGNTRPSDFPLSAEKEHHALADARWNKRLYDWYTGPKEAYEVAVIDGFGRAVWHNLFKHFPTFEDVRRALADHNHGRSITAWKMLKCRVGMWPTVVPYSCRLGLPGGNAVTITKFYL